MQLAIFKYQVLSIGLKILVNKANKQNAHLLKVIIFCYHRIWTPGTPVGLIIKQGIKQNILYKNKKVS